MGGSCKIKVSGKLEKLTSGGNFYAIWGSIWRALAVVSGTFYDFFEKRAHSRGLFEQWFLKYFFLQF